jgi:adenylate cyclase
MPKRHPVTFEGLLVFAISGVVFGLLYNTLFYPHTLVEYVEAATIGLILGIAAGFAELQFFEHRLRRRSLLQALAIRTLLYAPFVAVTLSMVLAVEPAVARECTYVTCVASFLAGPQFRRDLVFSTVFAFLAVLSVQVVLLVGTRNFIRLILGRYRVPRELYAVFMFVDLRDSTPLAERLGHERFSAFLQEFFNDLADGIHSAKGEVYQYVGDEVVVVWPGRRRAEHAAWLECYRAMRERVEASATAYRKRFGDVPEFKAGAHCGAVIATEVGTLQRAHVYHGDILNTASRIQGLCNQVGFDLLVSEALFQSLDPIRRAEFESLGAHAMKGKGEDVALYGYKPSSRMSTQNSEASA